MVDFTQNTRVQKKWVKTENTCTISRCIIYLNKQVFIWYGKIVSNKGKLQHILIYPQASKSEVLLSSSTRYALRIVLGATPAAFATSLS